VSISLQLVEIVSQIGKRVFETLAFSRLHDDLVGLAGGFHRVTGHDLPVVEHALRESLTAGVGAKVSGES